MPKKPIPKALREIMSGGEARFGSLQAVSASCQASPGGFQPAARDKPLRRTFKVGNNDLSSSVQKGEHHPNPALATMKFSVS